jgi:DNA-binding response OmpR family regulator
MSPVILIVEDDQLIQGVVEEALSEAGFESVIASSGESAVELLDTSKGKFRALVTDIHLVPDKMTGGMLLAMPARSIPPFPSFT